MNGLIKLMTYLLFMLVADFLHGQSLNDYLKIALDSNPGVQAKYVEFEAAMQRTARVNALPDPKLSVGCFVSPVETRVGPQQAKIGLSQMFPWFGTLTAKEDLAALQAQRKFQMFVHAGNQLKYDVHEAWYSLYEVERTLLLQQENLELLRTLKDLATTGFENNQSRLVDAIRVDIMIDNANTGIALLQDKKRPLLVRFNRLLNRVDTVPVNIPDSVALQPVPERYRKDSLLDNQPLLEALTLKFESAKVSEALAQKSGRPSFGVGIDYVMVGKRTGVTLSDNGKDVIMPMVSMSLPIFRKKYEAFVRETQLIQEAISLEKDEVINNLMSQYEMAWFQLEKSKQLVELYDKQIQSTKRVIDLLVTDYATSGKDFEEILRMQQTLLQYQIARASAVSEFYTALAKLDFITAKSEKL